MLIVLKLLHYIPKFFLVLSPFILFLTSLIKESYIGHPFSNKEKSYYTIRANLDNQYLNISLLFLDFTKLSNLFLCP